jgi:chromosome segregation ATPase
MSMIADLSETSRLRSLLTSITAELKTPFLERRFRQHSHKSDLLDELNDAITELTNREKDLQAAAGIALMLLEHTETLQDKLQKAKNAVQLSNSKAHHLAIEVDSLAEALKHSEKKIEELQQTVAKAEETAINSARELETALLDKKTKCEEICESQTEDDRNEWERVVKEMMEKKRDLEKENRKMQETLATVMKENCVLKEEKDRNLNKANFWQEKAWGMENKWKTAEEMLKELETANAELEASHKALNSNFQRIKHHSERLEEELSILGQKKPSIHHPANQSSLHSELSLLENPDEESISQADESFEDPLYVLKKHTNSFTNSTRYMSFQSYSRIFSVANLENLSVSPTKSSRKPAPEEFFALATQAVKMNSPYMENICCVPTQALMEQALKDEIPFHKWYQWIERQLNSIYISSLYKKNAKFSLGKASQKKQIMLHRSVL